MKRHGEVDIGKAMSYNGTVAAAFPGLAGDVNGGLSAEAIIHAYRTERMANKIATFTLAVADFLHTYPGEVPSQTTIQMTAVSLHSNALQSEGNNLFFSGVFAVVLVSVTTATSIMVCPESPFQAPDTQH
ncbi:hypothetical protein D9611_000290 [Ephemerocybe angulata]|uniref:Uncharacterized protein n=1 Tax=Ephemerocybe angulata TaxID=980116 RepID=A0A8H5F6R5_9AGAR|nr:hypothetical protein D9611_000290 [Tulosesus angulatus]